MAELGKDGGNMTRIRVWGLVCVMVGMLCAGTWGDLTAEQTNEARMLIGQLTSPEFRVRQDANKRLVDMDEAVLPVLKAAMAEAKDDDARLRCRATAEGDY